MFLFAIYYRKSLHSSDIIKKKNKKRDDKQVQMTEGTLRENNGQVFPVSHDFATFPKIKYIHTQILR